MLPLPARRLARAENRHERARPLLCDRRRWKSPSCFSFQVFVNSAMTMGIAPINRYPAAVRLGRWLIDDHELPGDGNPPGHLHAARRSPGRPWHEAAKQPLAALSVFLGRSGAARGDQRPLAVAGCALSSCRLLARELRDGGDPSAVVEGRVEGAAVLVWVGGDRRGAGCTRRRRPACRSSRFSDEGSLPYVLRSHLVRVPSGAGLSGREAHRRPSWRSSARTGRDSRRASASCCARRSAKWADRSLREAKRPHLGGDLHPRRRSAGTDAEPDQGSCCASHSPYSGKMSTAQRAIELLGVVGARLRFPHGRAGAARPRAGRRLGGQGRGMRTRGPRRSARRPCATSKHAAYEGHVRSRSYALSHRLEVTPAWP